MALRELREKIYKKMELGIRKNKRIKKEEQRNGKNRERERERKIGRQRELEKNEIKSRAVNGMLIPV